MKMLLLFIALNVVNVLLQTVKSIATIKAGKLVASTINAIAFGLYTYVIFYTSIDGIELWQKALIVAIANFIGVYVVKSFEEKLRKDKLWCITFTAKRPLFDEIGSFLNATKIPFTAIEDMTKKYVVFTAYCNTQNESLAIKDLVAKYGVKYSINESKTL